MRVVWKMRTRTASPNCPWARAVWNAAGGSPSVDPGCPREAVPDARVPTRHRMDPVRATLARGVRVIKLRSFSAGDSAVVRSMLARTNTEGIVSHAKRLRRHHCRCALRGRVGRYAPGP